MIVDVRSVQLLSYSITNSTIWALSEIVDVRATVPSCNFPNKVLLLTEKWGYITCDSIPPVIRWKLGGLSFVKLLLTILYNNYHDLFCRNTHTIVCHSKYWNGHNAFIRRSGMGREKEKACCSFFNATISITLLC